MAERSVGAVRDTPQMLEEAMRKRAEAAFSDESAHGFGEKYLELLYANWSEIMKSARRAVLLAVLLALSFLLLDPSATGTLKLGPLETDNAPAALVLLPAIISYLLFEAIDLTIYAVYYREASNQVMRTLFPAVHENGWARLLEPAMTFAWGVGSNVNVGEYGSRGKLVSFFENVSVGAILVTWGGGLAFLGYAYIALFENGDTNVVMVIGSLAFTLFNVVRACLQCVILNRVLHERVEPKPNPGNRASARS